MSDESSEQNPTDLNGKILDALNNSNEANEKLVDHIRAEQKQRSFRMFLWFLPVLFMIGYTMFESHKKNNFNPEGGYSAEVSIMGVIAKGNAASAAKINPALQAAFKDEKAKGVIITIDSPGGSPSESQLIHDEIRRLQKDYDRPVTIMSTGSLTSGAYWIALAGEEINAMAVNMVGSIGVIMSMYDLSGPASQYGVRQHIITAGKNKARGGLLNAPDEADLEKFHSLVDQIHVEFKDLVLDRRGDRLKGDHDMLFSGDFWLGREALKLGLIDRVTTPNEIKMEKYGTITTLDYTAKPGLFEGLNPLASTGVIGKQFIKLMNEASTQTVAFR